MEERERNGSRVERLTGQVQEHGRVLTNRVEHDRPLELGNDLTHHVNGLSLQLLEVGPLVSCVRRHGSAIT